VQGQAQRESKVTMARILTLSETWHRQNVSYGTGGWRQRSADKDRIIS
jgi:hypothetical protein